MGLGWVKLLKLPMAVRIGTEGHAHCLGRSAREEQL